MIYEIAVLKIKSGQEQLFIEAANKAIPHFESAEGCLSFDIYSCVENTSEYHLRVGWETVEHHTEIFRSSEGFAQWRELVGDFFAEPPKVVHIESVIKGF